MIDTKMKLSEHFTLGEMIKTSVKVNEFAKQNGLGEEDELLIEQKAHVIWIHFAVRPSGNRRRTRST